MVVFCELLEVCVLIQICRLIVLAMLSLTCVTISLQAHATEEPPELKAMVAPLQEVEAMLANGTYANGDFSSAVSKPEAAAFVQAITKKLRLAKTEYVRVSKAIRTSKQGDTQWYRMDALLKEAKSFHAALQRHSSELSKRSARLAASPKASAATAPKSRPNNLSNERPTQRQAGAGGDKAVRPQQANTEVAVTAKIPQALEPTGPNWRNSYIPNIAKLKKLNGFFSWPWSMPSWKAVLDKAASEQKKGRLGSSQVKQFTDFVLESAEKWPAVGRLEDARDAQYVLDLVRTRESTDGRKVVDLWISRASWKIQRNSLGVILSRTKPGYLLYEDPSGQACILKELWVKEAYAGGSTYEKASAWRYSKVRFQSCDRR